MDAQKDIPVVKFDKTSKDNKEATEMKSNDDLNVTKESVTKVKGDPKCRWCWGRGFIRLVRDNQVVTETCQCVRKAKRKLEQKKFEEGLAAAAEKKKTRHAT